MTLNTPIGIENYIVAQNYYYIDKTMLIKDIVANYFGKSLLITRPRRFGKSLNLSMLDCFFSNKYDSKAYFMDKHIYLFKDLCDNHMNKYPVIRLNFKDIGATSYKTLCEQIIDSISVLYMNFPEVLSSDKLFDIEKTDFFECCQQEI